MNIFNRAFLIAFLLVATCLFLPSCSSDSVPKPRGYYRIDFPKKEYQQLINDFPFTFSYPVYASIEPDNSRLAEKYWVNVYFPYYKARIHISYKDAQGRLDSLVEDTYKLTYKHAGKADAISQTVYSDSENRVFGLLYQVKGNAASSYQFYVTDSVKHFLRGALYFSVTPNKDSLAPAIDFFGKDVQKLMETVRWKN